MGPAIYAAGVVTAANFEMLSAFFWLFVCLPLIYFFFFPLFFKVFEYLGCWERQLSK